MSKLNDLIAQAKDDDTKKLLRQVAAVVEADTRKATEASHAAALQERDSRHAAALKAKDREHAAAVAALNATIQTVEEANADLTHEVAAKTAEHQSDVARYERRLNSKDAEIARLGKSASNAKGVALVTTLTTMLLGIDATTRRRRWY